MLLCPDKRDGPPRSRPIGAFALIVFDQSTIGIVRRAHVIRVIGASQDVSVKHGCFALRLALNAGLAQDKISRSEILEAGGVEPPSEKPCNSKTTCLSRSDCFTGRAQSGQDALPASPMILPPHYGPKRDGQPTV